MEFAWAVSGWLWCVVGCRRPGIASGLPESLLLSAVPGCDSWHISWQDGLRKTTNPQALSQFKASRGHGSEHGEIALEP